LAQAHHDAAKECLAKIIVVSLAQRKASRLGIRFGLQLRFLSGDAHGFSPAFKRAASSSGSSSSSVQYTMVFGAPDSAEPSPVLKVGKVVPYADIDGERGEWDNHFFVCDFVGANSAVIGFRMELNGAGFKVERKENFVSGMLCTDIEFGYDSKAYVTDYVGSWPTHGFGNIFTFEDPKETAKPETKEVRTLFAKGINKMEADWRGRVDSPGRSCDGLARVGGFDRRGPASQRSGPTTRRGHRRQGCERRRVLGGSASPRGRWIATGRRRSSGWLQASGCRGLWSTLRPSGRSIRGRSS
jgi:hypothetical protein